jgi:hypothetical protein
MTPQFASGLTLFIGLCLIAGWATGFRNRAYVGLLGLAFLGLAGFLLAVNKVQEAKGLNAPHEPMAMLARALLVLWVALLLVAFLSAIRETGRRLRDIREGHQASAEALLEMMKMSQARKQEQTEEDPPTPPAREQSGPDAPSDS